MKRERPWPRTLGWAVVALLGTAACRSGDGGPGAPTAAPPPSTAAVASGSAEPTPSAAPVTAPFMVGLLGPPKLPPRGAVELTLTIDTTDEFKGETTVDVQLPAGVKLTAGAAKEKIPSLPKGTTTRVLKLESKKKLSSTEPIRIVVEASDPEGKFGVRAERTFPAAEQQ